MSVKGCYERSKDLNYTIFAIDKESNCFTSPTAANTYKKYGPYDNDGWPQCLDGNEVYEIKNEGRLVKSSYYTYK